MTDLEVQVRMVWAWAMTRVQTQIRALHTDDPERGELLPWVIITALLAAAAIVLVAIIVGKAKTTAENVKTQ